MVDGPVGKPKFLGGTFVSPLAAARAARTSSAFQSMDGVISLLSVFDSATLP
jgi:hypothetical protein